MEDVKQKASPGCLFSLSFPRRRVAKLEPSSQLSFNILNFRHIYIHPQIIHYSFEFSKLNPFSYSLPPKS